MTAAKWLRRGVPPLVSVGLLAWIASTIPAADLAQALADVRWRYLAAAFVVSIVANTVLAGLKWRVVMGYLGHGITAREAIMYRAATQSFDFVLPKNTGGLVLAGGMWRERGLAFNRVLSSFLFDKAMNLIALIAYAGLGLVLIEGAVETGAAVQALTVGAGLVGIFALLLSAPVRRALLRPAAWLGERLEAIATDLLATFEEVPARGVLFLFAFSLAVQASDVVTALLAFAAFGVDVPAGVAVALLIVVVLVSNIPVAASGMGTREAALVVLFASYGDRASLFGVGLAITVLEHIVPSLVGLLFVPEFLARAVGRGADEEREP